MGGGGSWNPVTIVENAVSSAGDMLASIDPGPAIGDAGVAIDNAVNDTVPGGWATVGTVAVMVAAPYLAPALGEAALGEAAFTGLTETGLATLAGEGAVADTIGTTLLAGGLGEGAAGLPLELLPEMIPSGIPIEPGISLGEAQLAAGVTPMELVPEMIPEGIPVDPGISLAEGQINAGAIPSELKEVANAINKARQIYGLGNALLGGGGTGRTAGGLNYMPYGYGSGITDLSGGTTGGFDVIKNLTPGLTAAKQDYTLSGMPDIQETVTPVHFSEGGGSSTTATPEYDPFSTDKTIGKSTLTPALTKAQLNYILTGLPGNLIGKAKGGSIQEHNPEFFSEGGLGSMQNRYVKGAGDGTSDSIPAMLANGEFVIPADVVSSLGNGSNDSGAKILDEFLSTIRKHKRVADAKKLPPDSKGPLAYLLDAKRKVKA
jgi:hypothetical protein